MAEVAQLAGWVDRLDEVAVETAESMLHVGGILPPPTVHILAADLEPPYVGCLTCRPFYRGEDAWAAVAALGVLPSALGASRLVLTWEHADLCTALELPGVEGFPAGVVVVDAGRQGHTLRWHPMRMLLGPRADDGVQTVIPEWGTTQHFQDGALLEPVAELLAVWRAPREWPDVELLQTYASLEGTGYEMRWIRREVDAHAPSWARLLNPLMQ